MSAWSSWPNDETRLLRALERLLERLLRPRFTYVPPTPTLTIETAAAILDRQDRMDALAARRFVKPHIRLKARTA